MIACARICRAACLGIFLLLPASVFALGTFTPSSISNCVLSFNIGHTTRKIFLQSNGACYDLSNGDSSTRQSAPLVRGHYTYQGGSYTPGKFTIKMNDPAPTLLDSVSLMSFQPGLKGNFDVTDPGTLDPVFFSLEPRLTPDGFVANISTRCLVNSATPAIAGFIVGGTVPRLFLIRVAGPTLAQFGVPAAVADPSLRLFKGQSLVASNDDWGASTATEADLSEAFGQVAAFPFASGSKDAAVLVILEPGIYSAMGRSDQVGEVLVEVYLVP